MSNIRLANKIKVKEFNFTNLSGGTGASRKLFYGDAEEYKDVASLIITRIWDDYEIGIRGWATPDPSDKKLMEYLKKNCKQGHKRIYKNEKGSTEMEWIDEEGEFVVYWGEFDIIK